MARVFRLPGGRRNRLWWTEDRVVRAGARETRRVAPIKKFPTFPETTSSRSRSVRLSARAPSGEPDVARAGGMIPHWRIERNWHFRRVRERSTCSWKREPRSGRVGEEKRAAAAPSDSFLQFPGTAAARRRAVSIACLHPGAVSYAGRESFFAGWEVGKRRRRPVPLPALERLLKVLR